MRHGLSVEEIMVVMTGFYLNGGGFPLLGNGWGSTMSRVLPKTGNQKGNVVVVTMGCCRESLFDFSLENEGTEEP